jgi:rhodanese-related sulfurtransferase
MSNVPNLDVPCLDVFSYAEERKDVANAPFLLDVREPHEASHCAIEGSVLIPLGQLQERFDELPRDKAIVVQCHHGGRSARAVQFLIAQGFTNIRNLSGGIDAWSIHIDTTIPRY